MRTCVHICTMEIKDNSVYYINEIYVKEVKNMNKEWFKAAGIRAIKTFAQSFASMITVGAAINEIDWRYTASVAVVSAVYSLATSLAGLPEVKSNSDPAESE